MFSAEKSRRDKAGRRWNFAYWHGGALAAPAERGQRLFFWNDEHTDQGVVVFLPGATVPYSRMKSFIEKLVASRTLRARYKRQLHHPIENFYSTYPVFAEEVVSLHAWLDEQEQH